MSKNEWTRAFLWTFAISFGGGLLALIWPWMRDSTFMALGVVYARYMLWPERFRT